MTIPQVHDREAPAPVRVCPDVRDADHQGEHVPGIIITNVFRMFLRFYGIFNVNVNVSACQGSHGIFMLFSPR